MGGETMLGRRPGFWAGTIILATGLARLAFLFGGQLDLVMDEAQYWDWTRRLQLSYYSKPPLIAYIIALWTGILGNTEIGVRAGAFMGAAATQALLYLGVAKLFGRPRVALWVLVIASTTPLFLASGLLMTTDNPLLVCWLGALLCLLAASQGQGGAWPWLGLAICMALGLLAKYMMLAFAGVALLHGLILQRAGLLPKGFWPRLAAALTAGTVVGLAPVFAWNIENGFAAFKHVGNLAGVSGNRAEAFLRPRKLPEYVGSQIGLLSPWWLAATLAGSWAALRQVWGKRHLPLGLSQIQAALLVAGFWPMFAFFLAWSLHTKIEGNWPAMCYASGLISAGFFWHWFWREGRGALHRARKVWLALAGLVFMLLHLQGTIPLPHDYDPALRLKGWSDLGNKLAELRQASFVDPTRVFFFSSAYDTTAALAFYAPGQPFTYCVNLGRRMNQYDLWPGPHDKLGWDAVFVERKPNRPVPDLLLGMFDSVEPVYYRTRHKGRPAQEFTFLVCRGFNGHWPQGPTGDY
ncbi:ArnT family glycosyltransferase [Desulfocurvibacter africanus]|nr:glycosyltransferase family 39 protein [Desulfocurvibacter africanus]